MIEGVPSLENDSKHTALVRIEEIKSQLASSGANDSEFSDIRQIQTALENDEITPKESLSRAEEILNNKQNYH